MLLVLPLLAAMTATQVQAPDRYSAAAEAHANCDDGALAWIASLDGAALEAAVSAAGIASWPTTTVASAVVMHTRIAATLWRAAGPGWQAHLDRARRLVARLERDPGRHPWLTAWYSTAVSHYLVAGDAGQAQHVLETVPRARRREPLIQLADGAVQEFLASSRLTKPEKSGTRADARRALEAAARIYEDAASSAPVEPEAAVRLARAHLALGRPDRAAAALRRSPHDPRKLPAPLAYYAGLVAGRVHEEHGDLARAEASYRSAAASFPSAQTPAIALARLYARGAASTAARAEIEQLLARSSADADIEDPWTIYYAGQYWRTATLLQEMMTGGLRCAR